LPGGGKERKNFGEQFRIRLGVMLKQARRAVERSQFLDAFLEIMQQSVQWYSHAKLHSAVISADWSSYDQHGSITEKWGNGKWRKSAFYNENARFQG
jgi:hypothetical protein